MGTIIYIYIYIIWSILNILYKVYIVVYQTTFEYNYKYINTRWFMVCNADAA